MDYETLQDKVNAGIKGYLVGVDLPLTTAELQLWSKDITRVVFSQLKAAGMTEEHFDRQDREHSYSVSDFSFRK